MQRVRIPSDTVFNLDCYLISANPYVAPSGSGMGHAVEECNVPGLSDYDGQPCPTARVRPPDLGVYLAAGMGMSGDRSVRGSTDPSLVW